MKPLCVFLLGVALRVILIAANPIIWGGEPVLRLYDRFDLVRGHQLPALQALIAAISRISMEPLLIRYLMALIGGLAGLGFYWVINDLFGARWAFPAALLFVTHPYILAVSTEPFQEILMLAGLLFAFHYSYTGRWIAAGFCLAVACLTRYEAWAACPVLAVAYLVRKDRSPAGWAKAAFVFGCIPVLWIALHQGLTQTGHFVVERHLSIWRLQRYAYLAWITAKFSQATVLALAVVGAWRLCRDRSLLDWRMCAQITFVALFLIAILFSAHGLLPDPERYVTSREAHIPMYFVLLLAAAGLAQWPRWSTAIVSASVVLGVAMAFWYVHGQTADPTVRLSYQVARTLDRSLAPGERALLLTRPLSTADVDLFLNKVKETGTPADRDEAAREIEQAAKAPPEFQRVVVQSRLAPGRLVPPPSSCTEWMVVWSDYPEAARALAGVQPLQVLRSGPLSATIVRRSCAP